MTGPVVDLLALALLGIGLIAYAVARIVREERGRDEADVPDAIDVAQEFAAEVDARLAVEFLLWDLEVTE